MFWSLSEDSDVSRPDTWRQDKLLLRTQPARDVSQLHHSQLGSLTLFSPDELQREEKDRVPDEQPVSSVSERPIFPPTSLPGFCQLLQSRIHARSVLRSASLEDQQALAAVMMSELGLIWQDLKALISDPTLTQDENKQVRGEIFAEILRVCEQLYQHYLHLLDALRKCRVFSDQANRSRLAAQMAMDCTSLLNVQSIRCRVTMGIKEARKERFNPSKDYNQHGQQGATGSHFASCKQALSLQPKSGSKKTAVTRQYKVTMERDLQEINEKIGELDLESVYDLMPCHLEPIINRGDRQSLGSNPSSVTQQDDPYTPQGHLVRLKGCRSMSELGMEKPPVRPQTPLTLLPTGPCSIQEGVINAAEDLRRLLQDRVPLTLDKNQPMDPEADMPPLIKALTHSRSTKLQHLRLKLQKLSEEEERVLATKASEEEPIPPQGEVVSVSLSPQSIARTAAPRISDRRFTDSIHIQSYPPVYNDLTGEVESSSVRWLDRNLFAGADIKEIYTELSKSLSKQYLNFDEDPRIEPALTTDGLKNLLPTKKRNGSLLNPVLMRHNADGVSQRKTDEMLVGHEKPEDVTSKAHATWLQWWKSILSPKDYLQYISTQSVDYLGVIFHLYDSDEEDEMTKSLALRREEKERRRRQKMDALKRKKQEFVTGVWNVNSVLLGGLWKEPSPEDEESPDEESAPASRERACRREGGERELSGPTDAGPAKDQLQGRLQKIWNDLCFPDHQRLDMAIKYSSHPYREQLEEAIAKWECAVRLIQQRETLLSQLELFERDASDPNRFFQSGYRGTSIARMDESRHREKVNGKLSALEKVLSRVVDHIQNRFQDTVTYHGRPYVQKIRWDRIEMLYWLQQERRLQALGRQVASRTSPHAKLPPLDCTGPKPTPPGHLSPATALTSDTVSDTVNQ